MVDEVQMRETVENYENEGEMMTIGEGMPSAPPGAGGIDGDDDIPPAYIPPAFDESKDEGQEDEVPKVPLKEIMGRLLREVEGIKCLMVFGTITGVAAGGSWALWAYLFGEMLNILNRTDVGDRSLEIFYNFGGSGLALGVLSFLQFYFWIKVATKVGSYMRMRYYEALLYMEIAFFDKESTGGLAAKMASEAKAIELGMGGQFGQVCQFTGMFVGGFVVAFSQSWLFTFILLGLTPVVAVSGAIGGKFISEMSKEGADLYGDASARSSEVLAGVATVKSLNAGNEEVARFESLIELAQPVVKKKAFRVGISR